MHNLYNFISLLKNSFQRKEIFIHVRETLLIKNFKKILMQYGIILLTVGPLDTKDKLYNYKNLPKRGFLRTRYFKYMLNVQSHDFYYFKREIGLLHDSIQSPVRLLQIISKPSHPVFISFEKLKKIVHINKLYILSTPYGLVSHQDALKLQTGGILLCSFSF